MSTETTPAVERAAAAYLHMVPHCDGCAKESKGLLRRCIACKNLAVEFALHMLAAALDVEEMAQAIHESDQGPDVWDMEGDYYQDVYRTNARAARTALLGADS